ncbi:aldo/keto reductase [Primorskyibacter flagellatus]|uniref:Predicted oxidoreductase n=1 Tax=Primorskyibacter flagellatus TaxID=1387277 RepID=A0A1W2DSB9_9RHOB|nr:aldo/keto reductase [Primorskyibacter flagellatus]SMC99896.1 Predicted oxidoreductase [Primorskyibacter flagellatus]
MQTRRLGRHGPQVSAIGIGAMSFAGFYGDTTEAEAHALLDTAVELGVTHLDTSNIYGMGKSESIIGSYIASRGRNPFLIATKAGITRDPGSGARYFDNSAEHLEAELDKSLTRLGVDCVDLFYVHRREAARPIEEVTDTMAALVRKGKTRAIGLSEVAPATLRRAAAVHPIAAVQSEYSLSTRAPELGLVQECERQGTALVAFSPVGRALLTDRPPTADRVAASAFLAGNPRFTEPHFSANIAASAPLRSLAAESGTSAAALAIAWLIAKSPTVIPIPGTRNPAHLRELAAGACMELSDTELARIEAALPVGWAHGDRYTEAQWIGPERYC